MGALIATCYSDALWSEVKYPAIAVGLVVPGYVATKSASLAFLQGLWCLIPLDTFFFLFLFFMKWE